MTTSTKTTMRYVTFANKAASASRKGGDGYAWWPTSKRHTERSFPTEKKNKSVNQSAGRDAVATEPWTKTKTRTTKKEDLLSDRSFADTHAVATVSKPESTQRSEPRRARGVFLRRIPNLHRKWNAAPNRCTEPIPQLHKINTSRSIELFCQHSGGSRIF